VGGLLKKLGLKTEKVLRNYVIPHSEMTKLARLYEKYGIETSAERPEDRDLETLGDNGLQDVYPQNVA
jgi:hypothetical protein